MGTAGQAARESHGRLIVISNRLPVKLRAASPGWHAEKSTGGLSTAMNPILRRDGGVWVGWPAESSGIGGRRRETLNKWEAEDGLVPVELPADAAENFHEGYSNQTLWPLFHHFPSRLAFNPRDWAAYRSVNMLFRDAVVKQYRDGDSLWIHDYQLMLLPKLLRDALPGAAIGFFLHIPFPSSEVFRVLPEREELLEGLLGADLVAFHTYSYLQNFRSSLRRVLGRESRLDEVEAGGRAVKLDALPIGIAPDDLLKVQSQADTAKRIEEMRRRYSGLQILLAVDRMDYAKGIPERLRTYRHLLERNPELRGRVVLVQVAIPSRGRSFGYDSLRHQVDELAGEINGLYATPSWTPVIYIRRAISPSELVALYTVADVAWVSPLRDGMNLVAKEYVACRKEDGALILSEFAGAAEEMGESFFVNPNDQERTAETVAHVLKLDPGERRRRMAALQGRVRSNDVFAWSEKFLAALGASAAGRGDAPTDRPAALPISSLIAAYRGSQRRLLLLDYDGTLVGYYARPEDAAPSREVLEVLTSLAAVKENSVLVLSGRRRDQLEAWLGSVPGLWIAAEHGASLRRPDTKLWEALRSDRPSPTLDRVRPVLQHFVDRTPGSFLEEKEFSLVWHYRMAESKFSDWLAQELVAMLEDMLAETELRAIRGRKIVEVRPGWIHKGEIAERFLKFRGPAEFQFAIGDDRTDEDLFEALGAGSWTVHVGSGRSRSKFCLPDYSHASALLRHMAGPDGP